MAKHKLLEAPILKTKPPPLKKPNLKWISSYATQIKLLFTHVQFKYSIPEPSKTYF